MIFDPTPCALGEGPLWHPQRQELFWCDILNHRLYRQGQHWQFETFVSAAGWVDDTRLLLATATDLRLFDITTGKAESLVALEADNPVTRSNDGRADPQGGFWIGTMGTNAEAGAGAIYRYHRGNLRQLYAGLSIPNAICFAPDGRCAYFTDTPTHQIMRVALDAQGWPRGAPELHIDLTGTPYRPDGAVVDRDGNLWNAQWGAGRIAGYDPQGQFLESFSFAANQTSCPAFGGDDLSDLYCTSAGTGLTGGMQGATFVTPTRYTGQAEHQVIL